MQPPPSPTQPRPSQTLFLMTSIELGSFIPHGGPAFSMNTIALMKSAYREFHCA